jgi:5-methylcytosine-specific restriction endonuclease McrA
MSFGKLKQEVLLPALIADEKKDLRMRNNRYRDFKKKMPSREAREKSVEDIVRELKQAGKSSDNYREQSLKIHGLICAKCGREFGYKDRYLLTVHHKDGNHRNNPPDGSNWENLCVSCHDDEHSRGLLGDYMHPEDT